MELSGTDIGNWRLRQTEDGIQVENSILWLDARFTGGLSFLSCAHGLSGRTDTKVITTEETVKLLAINHIKLNALVRPYNQPISIGNLRLELLPSGAALGGASLYVETRNGTLLYAPHLQAQKTGITRTMQLQPADTLILGANSPFPEQNYPSRKKEKERLLLAVQAAVEKGVYPQIVCEPYAIAQEICKLLSEAGLPLAVHKSIYRINKIYEMYGSDLGTYHLLHRRLKEPHVEILPWTLNTRKQSPVPLPEGTIFTVEESLSESLQLDPQTSISERFTIGSSCDARDLKSVIQAVKPREVYFTGPYAKQYADELRSSKYIVRSLYPSHLPTLF